MMEMSRELIHFKRVDFFHPVMRSQIYPSGPSAQDISQYKKGLGGLELLLIRVKDDIINYNSNGRSYSNNLGFKTKD